MILFNVSARQSPK